MKIHPFLNQPNSVLVYQLPLSNEATYTDFQRSAALALSAAQIEVEGEKIALKPNVTAGEYFANPDTGIGTHPEFMRGLADFFLEQNTRNGKANGRHPITIIEDPRNSDDNHPRHWRGTGYENLAAESRIRLHCPTTYTCVKKTVPNPQVHPSLNVSRLAVAADTLLINVPKLKTHNLAITTLCLKNLMGLVNVKDRHYCAQAWQEMPESARLEQRPRNEWFDREMHILWQEGLAKRLVDTAQVIQPALNVVEGIVGREGTGFQRGRNRQLGLVVVGVNMVAVDSLVSYLMGFDPQNLVYLQHAARAGLGPSDITSLQVYTSQDGQLVPCPDVSALRLQPPMLVISNIKDEAPNPFETSSLARKDFVDK
jgi:uncharacterized protein (DUF362 family)